MDAEKIIALTSKDAQLQYHKGIKFKELEEHYDEKLAGDVTKSRAKSLVGLSMLEQSTKG